MQPRQLVAPIAAMFLLLAVSIVVAISIGAEPISWSRFQSDSASHLIIMEIRFPRVLLAALVGAILGATGSTFQTLLRNPLADPFVLGVSGGAAAAAALAVVLGFGELSGIVFGASFCGAILATVGVFLMARRGMQIDLARLVMSGLALNALFSAIIMIVLGHARGGDLSAALRWMMGSLAGARWSDVLLLSILFVLAVVVLYLHAADFRLMSFGEEDARARGVAVERVKITGYFVASIATGAAVAVSGVIGFVGLMVPHLMRSRWGSDYRINLPLSALAGAVLLVLADLLSRWIMAPAELPVGAFLAILGVPFFIWILRSTA